MFTSNSLQSQESANRDKFIKSISESAILRLASAHHHLAPCSFFTPRSRDSYVAWGSFNVCYFVQVGSEDRCVVRIPLRPCLAVDPQSKIEFEIAAMKCVFPTLRRTHLTTLFSRTVMTSTTIPIPRIRAYSSSADNSSNDPLSAYMIVDFVDGKPLSIALKEIGVEDRPDKLCGMFGSLADILIQLRHLEFPSIGRLRYQSDDIIVDASLMSIDINEQALEGYRPLEVQASFLDQNNTLKSTKKYTDMLLRLAHNDFLNKQAEEGANAEILYHLHLFSDHCKRWLDPNMEKGPFVLVHGDLEPHNILVDGNMSIIAVLDWEWSRVIPAQFFHPPLWLEFTFQHLVIPAVYNRHMNTTFKRFLETVSEREAALYGDQLLTAEWSRLSQNGGFLFAHALENWAGSDIDDVVYGYIHPKYYGGTEDLPGRVQAYLVENPLAASVIDAKERRSTTHGDNLQRRKMSAGRQLFTSTHSASAIAMGSFLAGVSFLIWKRIH